MNRLFPSHSDPCASPAIAPLRRLAVRNGLLLDAERWQVAHDYHRQRQNLHYQALHLPGIVCGLEVAVVPPPEDVGVRYRDQRWLQVTPGVAIDAHGNLVVVDQPVHVHLASQAEAQPHWVYLVVRHVDPEGLQRSQPTEIIAETFRIDEKKQPPNDLDIEICRILLPPEDVALAPAQDVFAPQVGELDLRYRQAAQLRPQGIVRAAFAGTGLATEDDRTQRCLDSLLMATDALYPALRGDRQMVAVDLEATTPPGGANGPGSGAALAGCDLFYITHRQCLSLAAPAIAAIQHHLHQGGVLLVELPSRDGNFAEMGAIARELTTAIADLQGSQRFSQLRSQLVAEQATITADLTSQLALTQQALLHHLLGEPLTLAVPDDNHPLRRAPFAFSQWPTIQTEPLHLSVRGGIVLAIGDLSLAWAASADLDLPRDRVRAAQELGINLLHFAWQRHHRTQIQQSSSH